MKLKKTISFLLTVVILLTAFAACGKAKTDDTVIRIGGMTGPTSMGLVKALSDGGDGVEFTLAGSADELTPKLVQGQLDMAAVPANLASVLYNNTEGKIQVLAVNTLGVLYIVDKGTGITSLEDLKGKTLYATGKNTTPEYSLRYILTSNGIDPDNDLTIEWKSEATEVVATLATLESGVAMLPQPYVTVAQTQIPELVSAIDLTAEWNKLDNGSSLVTGVLVARKEFVDAHPERVKEFLKSYEASIAYANANPEEASVLIEQYNVFKAAVAKKAIPFCNLAFLSGNDMKAALEGYLGVLFAANPKAVGGKLPDAGFYYGAK
ncbi:MAG: ABC transporter substrate-binding protein [Clostridia bacterium]|nr:ABC transporter substrate-binding protein [Clostridia bacterium]